MTRRIVLMLASALALLAGLGATVGAGGDALLGTLKP